MAEAIANPNTSGHVFRLFGKDRMERSYLVRYGVNGQVGRFGVEPGHPFQRGETVVVRTHRGTELGEVLTEVSRNTEDSAFSLSSTTCILRAAAPEDLRRWRQAGLERDARFSACLRVFEDGVWPIEMIDVEPLFDDRRTVIHYLGPHRLDVSGVLAAFRDSCNLDVMLQPAGRDEPAEDDVDAEPVESSRGMCGSEGGCGTGGGCGSGGGSSSGSGGCGDCGVKKLLSARR